jgi:hypothetical protein
MLDRADVDEQVALAQRLDHRLLDGVRRPAFEVAVSGQHPTRLVDRHQHGQLMHA